MIRVNNGYCMIVSGGENSLRDSMLIVAVSVFSGLELNSMLRIPIECLQCGVKKRHTYFLISS